MTTPDELRAQAAALEAQATELERPITQVSDLDNMSPAQINEARRSGRLDELLRTPMKEN